MNEHLTRDEFLAHMGPIRDDIREMTALIREQNGRVRAAEQKIVVLEERNPNRGAAGVSALISGVIAGLAMWISSQKGQ